MSGLFGFLLGFQFGFEIFIVGVNSTGKPAQIVLHGRFQLLIGISHGLLASRPLCRNLLHRCVHLLLILLPQSISISLRSTDIVSHSVISFL